MCGLGFSLYFSLKKILLSKCQPLFVFPIFFNRHPNDQITFFAFVHSNVIYVFFIPSKVTRPCRMCRSRFNTRIKEEKRSRPQQFPQLCKPHRRGRTNPMQQPRGGGRTNPTQHPRAHWRNAIRGWVEITNSSNFSQWVWSPIAPQNLSAPTTPLCRSGWTIYFSTIHNSSITNCTTTTTSKPSRPSQTTPNPSKVKCKSYIRAIKRGQLQVDTPLSSTPILVTVDKQGHHYVYGRT